MQTDEIIKVGERLGTNLLILLLVMAAIWKIARAVFTVLFEPEKGLLVVYVQHQNRLMDTLASHSENVNLQLTKGANAQEAQVDATRSLKRAFGFHADAMGDIADGINPDVGAKVRSKMTDLRRELDS